MEFIHQLFDWFEYLGEIFVSIGHLGLAFYTIIETLLIIPPIEIVLLPLAILNPDAWFWYALNAIIFTFVTTWVGYYIGIKFGYSLFKKVVSEKYVKSFENLFEKYGILAVALVAFTPIPYTIAVYMGGIVRMDFKKFMTAAMLGRIPRFLIGAYVASRLQSTQLDAKTTLTISIVGAVLVIGYFIFDVVQRKRKVITISRDELKK